jgi:hypothetical protein
MSGGGATWSRPPTPGVKPLSGMWANVCATGELLKSRKFHFPKSHALHLPDVELRIIWVSPLCPAKLAALENYAAGGRPDVGTVRDQAR